MKAEKREKRKRMILEVAKKSFFSNGYRKTSIRNIAKECDYAVGTVYNYFPSKNALLLFIFKESISKHLEKVEDMQNVDLPTSFFWYFEKVKTVYLEYPKSLWREVLAAAYSDEDMEGGSVWSIQYPILKWIQKSIKDEIEEGKLHKDIHPSILSYQIFSIFFLRFLAYINTDMKKDEFMGTIDISLQYLLQGLSNV